MTRHDDWVAVERRHGTLAEYKAGCRCPSCTAANTRYVQDYRARRRCNTCGTCADCRARTVFAALREARA